VIGALADVVRRRRGRALLCLLRRAATMFATAFEEDPLV
jgi:hypothetical protein